MLNVEAILFYTFVIQYIYLHLLDSYILTFIK